MSSLKYVFNGGKATESQVKIAFKDLFQTKKTEIFEVIWENQSLRGSLFDLSNYPPNLNQSQLKQMMSADFDVLVSNTQSSLYQFIKSQ